MQHTHRQVFRRLPGARLYRPGLPLAIRGVMGGLVVAFLVDSILGYFIQLPSMFGFSMSSLGWLIPLFICGFILARSGGAFIRFPYYFWLPWALWVGWYLLEADQSNALQRSVMLLAPLVVGLAVSTIRVDRSTLDRVSRAIDRFFWLLLIAVGMSTGLLQTGELNAASGFAAGSISASLIAAWYAGKYVTICNQRDLLRWCVLAAVPVLATTRTGMLAVALTLPLTLAPWPMARRLITMGVLVAAGLAVFQMERIQEKMFFSGQGSLQDAIDGVLGLLSGEQRVADFATSGRMAMAEALRSGLQGNYWFGLGANATEKVTSAFGGLTHPHNDWLRLQYDYGTLGMSLFALTMLAQAGHAYFLARRLPPETALYLYVGAGAFLPMAIFMFTDNVILYASWFGNLHFALLGLGYAATKELRKQRRRGWIRFG